MMESGRYAKIGMRPIALVTLLLTAALVLAGCGALPTGSYDSETADVMQSDGAYVDERGLTLAAPEAEFAGEGSGEDAASVPADQRFIIRNVGVRIQVDDVEDAVEQVRDEVDAAGGIVTGLQVSTDDNSPIYRYEAAGTLSDGAPLKGYLTARVPAEKLSAFMESVSGLGTVLRQSSDESDVTQEHIDLSARLENLKSQEQRLREFFERAENVEEMLEIERELARVRGEIESLAARIAYLERQAAMATVTVELAGKQSVVSPAGSDWGFVRAVRTGVRGLVGTINAMIVVGLSALPLIAIAVVVWLTVRAVLRRRRARHPQPEPPVE